MQTKAIFLSFLVFLSALNFGSAIRCYDCGKTDGGCNDPANKTVIKVYEKECSKEASVCLKIMNPKEGDCWKRSCGVETDCNIYNECYTCTGELCNAATAVVYSLVTIVGMILLRFY